MNRPVRIEILGQPFTVVWQEKVGVRLHEDADYWDLGALVLQEQKLLVRVAQGEHQIRDTLLHEVIHAILNMTAQKDRFKPNDAHEKHPEEPVVAALATTLLAVLRGNPSLVQWLTEAINDPDPASSSNIVLLTEGGALADVAGSGETVA